MYIYIFNQNQNIFIPTFLLKKKIASKLLFVIYIRDKKDGHQCSFQRLCDVILVWQFFPF